MSVIDTVNRIFREFKRYTGDGEAGEPTGAPLPVGDPQSGSYSPKKSELRAAFTEIFSAAGEDAEAAEEALAAFERLYLGAKASDPATDNEGLPLEAGALYFNTTSNRMRVWTGAWQDQSDGINWRGPYNAVTSYVVNDGVTLNGSSFRNILAGSGVSPSIADPPVDNASWAIVAAKGANGLGTIASIGEGVGIVVDTAVPDAPVVSADPFFIPPFGPALSLVSGVQVPSSDVAGATNVYVMPQALGGDLVVMPAGADRALARYSEIPVALTSGNNLAATGYDIWMAIVGGVVVAGTLAWANSGFGTSSRGTGAGTTEAEFVNGQWTNKNALVLKNGGSTYNVAARSALLVGSFKTTIAGATEDSRGKRLVSSLFAPARKALSRTDAAASWSYSTAALRTVNGDANNVVQTFQCMGGRDINLKARSLVVNSTSTARIANTEIGMHANTAAATAGTKAAFENAKFVPTEAEYSGMCPLGAEEWRWLEIGSGFDAHTWFGAGSNYKVGLDGRVLI